MDSVKQVSQKEKTKEASSVKQVSQNDWQIEEKTKEAIKKNAKWLQAIAKERIRDEFVKIIMGEKPDEGILLLRELGLLEFIIPEIEKGFGVGQNRHHIYTIFEHGILSLKFAAQKKYNLAVRLAALLHDVAKPQAKRGEGEDSTFYNHDIMGARLAARILERLRFNNEMIEHVANLIRHHMFVYDVGAVTEAGIRRLLVRVGPENMKDLLSLRVADRLGSGVPKAQPYRLRHFQYMVEKVQHDPISAKMLKINGHDLMSILKIQPGPKIGAVLDILLAEVIEDPAKNDKEYLQKQAKKLSKSDLLQLRGMAKQRIEEEKEEEDKIIKDRYWVK
jgi:poly(A) polymerase/tRNA nucleotidyltransferase (CCA-adding enzyme)